MIIGTVLYNGGSTPQRYAVKTAPDVWEVSSNRYGEVFEYEELGWDVEFLGSAWSNSPNHEVFQSVAWGIGDVRYREPDDTRIGYYAVKVDHDTWSVYASHYRGEYEYEEHFEGDWVGEDNLSGAQGNPNV